MNRFGHVWRIGARGRRWLAALGAAVLFAAQVAVAAYIAHEADHDCPGDGCRTCVSLQQCVAHFQAMGSGLEAVSVRERPHTESDMAAIPVAAARTAQTLVSLKVRMNS